MTHLLMTADAVGGVWTYALDLADALAPLDVSVTLAVMGPKMDAAQRAAARASAVVGLYEGLFALEWMPDPWDDVERAGNWLLALEDDLRPDVVHLNGYVHAALRWRAPTLVVAHSCVLSWWSSVHGGEAPAAWSNYRNRVTEGLRAAGDVVAPTAAMQGELQRLYGRDSRVIPNGRRSDWVHPTAKADLVLAAGRLWDEAKNLALLDRLAPDLAWPVVIAGEVAPPGGSSAWAGGGARRLGRLEWRDMAQWLMRAKVFVHPARYEPFGLGPLEAGLAGCALVLGDIPSLREVWADAAIYAAPDDEAALRKAVDELISHPATTADMGQRARQRALEFTAERSAAAYHFAYKSLVRQTRVSP